MSFSSIRELRVSVIIMQCIMLSMRCREEITHRIISFVSIQMMNNFAWKKWASYFLLHEHAVNTLHFTIDFLNKVPIVKRWSRRMNENVRISVAPPSIIMRLAPTSRNCFSVTKYAVIHLACILLPLVAGCQGRLDHSVPIGPATVQCDETMRPDCISVSRAFVLEHADLFDRLIRTTDEWQKCRERK